MLAGVGAKIIGSIVTIVVGGVVAAVTVVGLVNSQVNSSSDQPANVNNPSVDYGSNG